MNAVKFTTGTALAAVVLPVLAFVAAVATLDTAGGVLLMLTVVAEGATVVGGIAIRAEGGARWWVPVVGALSGLAAFGYLWSLRNDDAAIPIAAAPLLLASLVVLVVWSLTTLSGPRHTILR